MLPERIDRRRFLAGAASAALAACAPQVHDRTVRVLHLETNQRVLEIWRQAARRFEARHRGWNVEFRVMSSNVYASRLTTMLQAPRRPHIFYSWGGALVDTQRSAGFLADITDHVDPAALSQFSTRTLGTFRREGRLLGLPYLMNEIGLIGSARVLTSAGLKLSDFGTWEGFRDALSFLKKQGQIPICVGGLEMWQVSLILSQLALSTGGRPAILSALSAADDGFRAPPFERAAGLMLQLAGDRPFQDGFMGTRQQVAMTMFAREAAALTMQGTLFYRQASQMLGKPPSDVARQFPFLGFPRIDGASGPEFDVQGQLTGWLVSRGAPDEAIQFLLEFVGVQTQRELAAGGFIIPANLGASAAISVTELKAAAERLHRARYVQNAWWYMLGVNGGSASSDAAARLADLRMREGEATDLIQRGWNIERQVAGIAPGSPTVAEIVGEGR
jgi:raffinose/stachyose/melibiose transport system substrate-binding protein